MGVSIFFELSEQNWHFARQWECYRVNRIQFLTCNMPKKGCYENKRVNVVHIAHVLCYVSIPSLQIGGGRTAIASWENAIISFPAVWHLRASVGASCAPLRRLGVREVMILNYRDQHLDRPDLREAVGAIAGHMRRARPGVVVTCESMGTQLPGWFRAHQGGSS